jgi:hypothetical protein
LFSNWPSETLKSSNGVLNICPPKYNLSTSTITAHESPSDVILYHYISTKQAQHSDTVLSYRCTVNTEDERTKFLWNTDTHPQYYNVTSYNTTTWTITKVWT